MTDPIPLEAPSPPPATVLVPLTVTPKSIWQSKTMWFNLATMLSGLAWNHLKGYVTPEDALIIIAAGNMVLRSITTQAVQ